MTQCVILAGGFGTRIRVVEDRVPKALISVEGRPFAFHQLEWLQRQGVSNVVYCIGHQGAMIQEAIGDGAAFGLDVRYSDEGEFLRGTGGAIRLAADAGLLASAFSVLYADSYLPIAIAPVWRTSDEGRYPTMVVIQNEGRWDASNVVFRAGRVIHYNKSALDLSGEIRRHIDYGLSIIPRSLVIDRIPNEVNFDLAEFYTTLGRDGLLRGHEVTERFYEIGSPTGLAELKAYLQRAPVEVKRI